jgi:hypothetical protein
METPMTAHKVGEHVELDKDEARAPANPARACALCL